MKKKILSMAAAVLLVTNVYAQNFTAQQRRVLTEISSYVSKVGYSVEEKNDMLKIKDDGAVYYLEMAKEETDPLFVRFTRRLSFNSSFKKDVAKDHLAALSRKFGIKALLKENEVVLVFDMFFSSSSQLKDCLSSVMKQFDAAYEQLTE